MALKCIMIVAGEASGDLHGAKLAQSLNRKAKELFLFGVGGNAMHRQGVRLIVHTNTLSVMGVTEVVAKLPTIYRTMAKVKSALSQLKPDLLILIDSPEFNFHVASAAKKLSIPVLYYISPQIWAWRQYRIKKIKRLVDHMAVILPFEAPFYRKYRVPVTFVGHPLLDRISHASNHQPTATDYRIPVIGLVPGSRKKELTTLLPVMLEAAKIIERQLPAARFMVSCAESIQAEMVTSMVSQYAPALEIEIVKGSVVQVFKHCQLLVAASGTVTLEAALYGIPTVIVYIVSPVSYWIGKRLIKVKHIGIANLIAQKEILPELIQADASPKNIAEAIIGMINDPARIKQIKKGLLHVEALLGGAGASERVARIAFNLIHKKQIENNTGS